MSFVVQNIPHLTVSDGLTRKRSVGINKPRSAMLGVIYNFYPKTIYYKNKLAESDIFKMTYFKRGIVDFDIHLSECVSPIHYCIKLTSIRHIIPPNRLVHFNSLRHLLWENVMNHVTLYSLKCLFDGAGVLLVFDIYICQNILTHPYLVSN